MFNIKIGERITEAYAAGVVHEARARLNEQKLGGFYRMRERAGAKHNDGTFRTFENIAFSCV